LPFKDNNTSENSNSSKNDSDVIRFDKMRFNLVRFKKGTNSPEKIVRIDESENIREVNGKKYGNQVFFMNVEEITDKGKYQITVMLSPAEAAELSLKLQNAIK